MKTYWKDKINRLDEFEQFFQNYLNDEAIKSIQYISLRKKSYKGYLILVGITNMNFKEEIQTYAPRILKEIREYQETKTTEDLYEKSRLPTKLDIFEFNLEKKKAKEKERKIQEEQRQEWYLNPKDFLEKTDLQNQYLAAEKRMILNGVIVPIDHSEIVFKHTSAKCRIYMNEFDFEKTDKKGNINRFLQDNGKYYKFRNTFKNDLEIKLTAKIGECIIFEKRHSQIEITKQTYYKHRP